MTDIVKRLSKPHFIVDDDFLKTPERVLNAYDLMRREREEAAAALTAKDKALVEARVALRPFAEKAPEWRKWQREFDVTEEGCRANSQRVNVGCILDAVAALATIDTALADKSTYAGEGVGPSTLAVTTIATPSVSGGGQPAPDTALGEALPPAPGGLGDGEAAKEIEHQLLALLENSGTFGRADTQAKILAIIAKHTPASDRVREALERMMNQPTMNPLDMTPEQRVELWAAHEQARNALGKGE